MTEGEKTYLRITSYANYSSMNGIERDWIIKCIDDAIELNQRKDK